MNFVVLIEMLFYTYMKRLFEMEDQCPNALNITGGNPQQPNRSFQIIARRHTFQIQGPL
jgi:hypothetical protein